MAKVQKEKRKEVKKTKTIKEAPKYEVKSQIRSNCRYYGDQAYL
jgi:hypothetical protein